MTSRYNLTQQTVVGGDAQEFFLSDTEDNATEAITKIYFNIGSGTAASLSDFIGNTQFDAGLSVEWRSTTDMILNPADHGAELVGGFYLTAPSPGTFFNSIDMAGVSLGTMSPYYAAGVDLGLSGYFETEAGALISFGPAMPDYKSIGSNNNSSSSVNIEDKEYEANTGVVEFNVSDAHSGNYGVNGEHHYHWQVLRVDETSLYTDNGGTDDLAADGTPLATSDDDQTMGVYLNMRDGLASALVPSANDRTEALAAEIVTIPGPAVTFSLPHAVGLNALDVSDGGTTDWVDGGGGEWGPDGAGTFDQAIAIDLYIDMAALLDAEQHMTNGGIVNGIHLDYNFGSGAVIGADEMAWSEVADNDFHNSGLWSYSSGAGVIDNADGTGKIWLHLYESSDLHNALSSQGTDQAKIGTLFFDAGSITHEDIQSLTFTEARVVELASSSGSYQTPTNEFAIGSPRSVEATLNGSLALDPMSLPWEVILSAEDDIYIGRDDQDVGGGVYNPGIEGIGYSAGNDAIDMGLGYNYAFYHNDARITDLDIDLQTYTGYSGTNVTVDTIDADGVTPVTYYQQLIGVNEVWGSLGMNSIEGSDNDPYNHPSDEMGFVRYSYDDGVTWTEHRAGEYGDNYIVNHGTDGSIKGHGGDDTLNAYIHKDVFLDASNLADFTSNPTTLYGADMYGGRGADSLHGGIYTDDLEGGDYRGDRDSKDIDIDDFYNSIGHDFAAFDFGFSSPPASNLKAMTKLTIGGTDYAIDTSTINDDDTSLTALDKFLAAANAGINAVTQQSELWEYLTADTEGMTLHFAQGLSSPIPVNERGYYYSEEQVHHNEVSIPSWAPAFFDANGASQMVANGFAPSGEFIENSGDDNDRFVYHRDIHVNAMNYDHGTNTYDNANLSAINGDTIWDLDVGQNSLTLTSEIGEGIWFDAGVVNHNVAVDVKEYTVTDVTGTVKEYSATVTLAHAADASKTVDFVLEELNLPTLALSGDQFYNLVGTWETVKMESGILQDGFVGVADASAGEQIWMAKDIDILRFEWQAVGEKVGTAGTDNLVGTNGSNVFQAYGGNDVLNGSGGADSYHFTGNFGQDKILEFGNDTDIDAVQIGAAMNNVWIEREGRRGDDLKITVKNADTSGQISVGRHYNPYSNLTSVEEIHFGFDGEKSADVNQFSISDGATNGYQSDDIFVMRDGDDTVFVQNSSSDSYVYLNQNETSGGTTTVSFYESFGTSMAEVGLMIDYGAASYSDNLWVGTMTTGTTEKGGTVHLVSKGQVDITTGNFGDVSITADGANGYAVNMLTDPMDVNSSELLFNLIWEDASTWAA